MRRFCNLCGRNLTGQYLVYRRRTIPGALVVCETCEHTAPRCVACQIPMTPGTVAALCPRCQTRLPKCVACGKSITGPYYQDSDKRTFCTTCYQGSPRCEACGNPAVPDIRLPDGRHVCGKCHQTAILTHEKALEQYQRVLGIMARDLRMDLRITPALVLVDRDRMMAELSAAVRAGATQETHPELVFGLFVRRGRQRIIYVEYGLPQILLIQVLAHELGHAWQAENCPLLHDRLLIEGFAEWTAYRVLNALGAIKKSALMLKRTDLYGQGLHAMLGLQGRKGATGVLDALRACMLQATADEEDMRRPA